MTREILVLGAGMIGTCTALERTARPKVSPIGRPSSA